MAGRILVVDDEQLIADTLAAILRKAGYVADAVYSAEQALGYIKHIVPDLVLSDVAMPAMNGIELAIGICSAHATCQVLLISGNANSTTLLHEAGASGYGFTLLPKPIPPDELLRHIAAAFARRAPVDGTKPRSTAA